MPRTSQLPPRIPFHKKFVAQPTHEPSSFSPPKVYGSGTRHHRSLSHNSTLEDQPAWFDDLLSDSNSMSKGIFHCRSASDSFALFHDIVPNIALTESKDGNEEHLGYEEGGNSNGNGSGHGYSLESSCLYGPNSPRRKSNVEFSESSVLLALSSYVGQNSVQFVEEISQGSRCIDFNQKGEGCVSSNELNSDISAGKRHPGQRSRARKLQYIAELERTVHVFQALESELSMQISSLLQQRVLLSMENSKLKQQMARLQQQKLIMDGQYQTLKEEAELLKLGLASSLNSKSRAYAGSRDTNASGISWQMLDWEKLRL